MTQNSIPNFLEEVVVSDSKFELKKSSSGKSIILIQQETIENYQGQGLGALLRRYAGIEILGSRTYAGQNKTFSIRGGRNRQVLVLVDGVRVSDPSRIDNDFDLNFLSLDGIESIEILKGASSTLYGSAAAAGVISIKTKKIHQKFQTSVQNTVGTAVAQDGDHSRLSRYENAVQLSQTLGKLGIRMTAGQTYTDGMSAVVGTEKDPFSRLNFGSDVVFNQGEKLEIKMGFQQTQIDSKYDNTFPLSDANFALKTQLQQWYFSPDWTHEKGGLSLRLGYQKTKRDFQSDYPFQTKSENTTADLFYKHIFNEQLYGVFGTQLQSNNADYEGVSSTFQHDFYSNFVWLISQNFRINGGGRWNHHSTYGSHFTYSLNPSATLFGEDEQTIKLFTSLSSSFIAPSLYQLYDVYSGNIDLAPERNRSFELGADYHTSKMDITLAYFNRFENPSLIYDLVTYRYGNANQEARYTGAEVQLNFRISDRLQWDHQLTYIQTKNGDLRYLPKFSTHTALHVQLSKAFQWTTYLETIGKRFGLDNTTVLAAYALWDMRINYRFPKRAANLFLTATNLFNTRFVEIEGYATLGRNWVMGINYRFP